MAVDEYMAEYRGHVQACEEKLAIAEAANGASSSASPDAATRAALAAAERACEAAKDSLQLMELEGRSLGGAARQRLQATLRGYRDEVATLRTRLKELRSQARTPGRSGSQDRIREECFAGSSPYSDESTGRLLANNERIGRGTERLAAAHETVIDMENTGNAILGDLSKQRETLRHAQGTLRFAAEGLDSSRRLLTQMARRAAMNKLSLYVIIAILLGMLLLLAWTSSGGAASSSSGGAGGDVGGAGDGWQRKRP